MSHHDVVVNPMCGFYVSVEYPFLGASPDGLMEYGSCGSGIIEVKCPFSGRMTSLEARAEQWRDLMASYILIMTINIIINVTGAALCHQTRLL